VESIIQGAVTGVIAGGSVLIFIIVAELLIDSYPI
jgi:hypothetical protein